MAALGCVSSTDFSSDARPERRKVLKRLLRGLRQLSADNNDQYHTVYILCYPIRVHYQFIFAFFSIRHSTSTFLKAPGVSPSTPHAVFTVACTITAPLPAEAAGLAPRAIETAQRPTRDMYKIAAYGLYSGIL
jgi:hypothetical protein